MADSRDGEPDPFEVIDDDHAEPADEEPAAEAIAADAHLDRRHIKSIVIEKQLLYRAARYKTIVALVLIGSAGQLIWLAVGRFRIHDAVRAGAYLVVAIGFVIFSIGLWKKAKVDRQAAARTAIPEPEEAPDFSPLSDGSQFAENLKQMHRR